MIKGIINGIFKLIMSLVNLLLMPIDLLIEQFLPDISEAINYVGSFFDYIGDFVPFVISYTGLNQFVLNAIYSILVFMLTVPLMVHTIKLAVAWYNKLKL